MQTNELIYYSHPMKFFPSEIICKDFIVNRYISNVPNTSKFQGYEVRGDLRDFTQVDPRVSID